MRKLHSFCLLFGMILSANSFAWVGGNINVGVGGGNVHVNEGAYPYGPGYYDQGGYYGGGWLGPNVVINVPVQRYRRYYAPLCENVEVCDVYGECWLERYCE